jgi:hypothetical protein
LNTDNLYDIVEDDKDYKNISPSIRSMLRVVYPKLKFKKEYFIIKIWMEQKQRLLCGIENGNHTLTGLAS